MKLCGSEHKQKSVQNLFFGCVITVSQESQRLNKHKVSKPDCFFCSTHTVQCKNTYKQILVGDNYRSLKNAFFLCVGMNLPVDCRGKHNFWVCFWEKKTHSSNIGYVIDFTRELWSKHILTFFPSKKRVWIYSEFTFLHGLKTSLHKKIKLDGEE